MAPRDPVLPGTAQVRLFAHEESNAANHVQSWTFPACILTLKSPSVEIMLGETAHDTILHARIAEALDIREGEKVEFEFVGVGERCVVPVSIKDNIGAAMMIHGAINTGIIASFSRPCEGGAETMMFHSGRSLQLGMQSFWAGLRMPKTSRAILEFDGAASRDHASQTIKNVPSGYGYCVRHANKFGRIAHQNDPLLLQGYGYKPNGGSNQQIMEYTALIEGLWWAILLNIQTLWIRGDSEIIFHQVQGAPDDPTPQKYYSQVMELVARAKQTGITCIFEHIPRESNVLADSLANLGIDLKENATAVKWVNCNEL